MDLITVVVPCYNEEEMIPLFYKEIVKVMKKIECNFELLFIDDGSSDKTLDYIKKIAKKDKIVRYISFSRNFGKEAAIYAGLENANGDYVALMDVDLQDPPKLLIEMYDLVKNKGYDTVGTRRVTRKGEPVIRSFFARMFYKIINKMSKVEMVDGARDFRLMSKQVVNSVLSVKEYNRYSKGIFSLVGFKTKYIEYENIKRVKGSTKWSFFELFAYAINGIVSFTTTPLVISAFIGLLMCVVSFVLILIIIIKTLCFGDPVGGWPSMVCIVSFLSGIQLFCIGIMGSYLSKMYMEVKNRPIYIIKEKNK
ncbi:MAG: glycosyltransferase family 2 protein [Bacilli bacterium]|nr:glycosyltransferase family 2 protein [Bacilli bacterium]